MRLIVRSHVDLHDNMVYNLGDLTREEAQCFQYEFPTQHRLIPYTKDWQKMVTYEISLSEVVYTRTVYSGLDFLGDLGGLFSAVRALSLGLVIMC